MDRSSGSHPGRRLAFRPGLCQRRKSSCSPTGICDRASRKLKNHHSRWRWLLLRPDQPQHSNVYVATAQTVTRYLASGEVSSVTSYEQLIAAPLNNARSIAWNAEIQREVTPNLVVRTGVTQRNTTRDFFVEPTQVGDRSALYLLNTGRNRYREFQVTARYHFRQHVLNGSYVRSSAIGDLTTSISSSETYPRRLSARTNGGLCRSTLRTVSCCGVSLRVRGKSHSRLYWTSTRVSHTRSLTRSATSSASEMRPGGIPASRHWTSRRRSVSRCRCPQRTYMHLSDSVYFNLLNHFNPRDFQQNIASPQFGGYYNGVGRTFRGKFVLEF